jgi:hypothetical protein
MDVRIELPFISNTPGSLDGFIQWYHNLFGLPNSGRETVANNRFGFSLAQGGTTLMNHGSTFFGLSDVTTRFKYRLTDHINLPFKLAVAPYLKIPTGQGSRGLGSKRFDAGISLFGEKSLNRFHLTTQVGYTLLGDHHLFQGLVRNGFFNFGQSFEFQIMDGWSALVQLTGNTPAFKNTDIPVLSDIVLDLNVGFAGEFPVRHETISRFFYQFSFAEDVTGSGPSVDFSILFLAGIKYR